MAYEFTKEMSEISGFGGSYEAGCRAMLKAGLEWLDAHPEAELKFMGFKNVYGFLKDESEDAKELSEALMDASFYDPEENKLAAVREYGVTGAMHQAVIESILWILKNGWDAYVRGMSKKGGD